MFPAPENPIAGQLRNRLAPLAVMAFLSTVAAPAGAAEPPLRAGAEAGYPPFSVVGPDGRATGFSVELLRAAASAMDRELEFRTGPWTEVRAWLEQNQVQVLPLVGRTPEREGSFDFTFPYMSLHGAIVVREETADIRALADLEGRCVGVMSGDNAEEFLRRQDLRLDLRATPTYEAALRGLAAGRTDAVVVQRLVALRLVRELGLTGLTVLNGPIDGFRQDFCFAVPEGDRETLALLNEGLALVIADGTYQRLHAEWFAALELPSDRPLVIGGGWNLPPYEFLDDSGRPTGFDIDLVQAAARAVGMEIEIRLGPWSEIRAGLARGEIDAVAGMAYALEREPAFEFTPPHSVIHYVAVTRRGEAEPPGDPAALAGRRIVVQEGDIAQEFAVASGLGNRLTVVPSQETALRELAQGRHDCALVARLSALHWIEEHGWRDVLVAGRKPLLSPGYGFAALPAQKALLAQLADGLHLIEESGEYREIRDRWMGVYEAADPGLATVLRNLAWIALPLLVIVVAALLWSWSLRKQVAARTEQLRRSEEWVQAMIACSPVALFGVDLEGGVIAWNASAERIFGWTADEVMGRPLPIVPPERQAEFATLRRRILEQGGFNGEEVVRMRKGGAHFHGSLSGAPLRDADGTIIGVLGSMEDITERKEAERAWQKLQTQLVQAQKMESVGRLAGGVAHDFNNMLNVITGYSEMALARVDEGEDLHLFLTEILGAAERSAAITRQLLAFARQQTVAPRLIDLDATVERTLQMLRRLIGEDVELVWRPGARTWPVRIDPAQIDQILANLCVNARDAIQGVGHVAIETRNVEIGTEFCDDHPGAVPGEYVLLSVSDSGCGIAPENLGSIFEPFFTTKALGRGTGLGLAMVYGVVKQNDGFIDVESAPGAGTTVRIHLPRHVGDAVAVPDVAGPGVLPGRGETILMVEDDPAILRMGTRMLAGLGYRVLVAASPREAIRLVAESGDGIALLITDVIMPGMNGRDLADRLASRQPGLKIIYMSGYTADVIAHRGVLDAGVAFIQKPFSRSEIATKVRSVLDGAAVSPSSASSA